MTKIILNMEIVAKSKHKFITKNLKINLTKKKKKEILSIYILILVLKLKNNS